MREYNFCVRDKVFANGTHIMGIINVNEDSFFAQSRHIDDAVEVAGKFIEQGAEILDIGAQSTRPGAVYMSAIEEMSSLLPVVEAIRGAYKDIPISVDTFNADVAQCAIEVGADMINDVSCLKDGAMAQVVAQSGASICVMHNRRNSKTADLFVDKQTGLSGAIKTLLSSGVDQNKILLDGGIGFNKSIDEDWALLNRYDCLIDSFEPYPFLLGTSRKSMFGGDVSARLSATLDSTLLAKRQGVLFVRVHDIKENYAILHN